MKKKQEKQIEKKTLREQVLKSALASFRIEGINIPKEKALATLEKVELSLGK